MPQDLKEVRDAEYAAKRRAQAEMESSYANQTVGVSAIHGIGPTGQLTPQATWTLADEQEKNMYHHQEQARKAEAAVTFLRENPSFGEFIRLVRQGVIQF